MLSDSLNKKFRRLKLCFTHFFFTFIYRCTWCRNFNSLCQIVKLGWQSIKSLFSGEYINALLVEHSSRPLGKTSIYMISKAFKGHQAEQGQKCKTHFFKCFAVRSFNDLYVKENSRYKHSQHPFKSKSLYTLICPHIQRSK